MESNGIEQICADEAVRPPSKDTLDALILKGLDLIEAILDEHKKLELSLREGFVLMSKARYSMGSKSVGVLQLPSEDGRDIEARAKVNHTEVKGAVADEDHMDFFVVSRNVEVSDGGGDGLRKRTNKLEGPSGNKSPSDVTGTVSKKSTDPLNWFGVLVPQALRSSQQIFQDNVHSVCRLASLRSELESIRREYSRVSKEVFQESFEKLEIK